MKVIYVDSDMVRFEDRSELFSEHGQDCCESHYLSFADLTLADFAGLEFDLSSHTFFERVPDYGIRLLPTNGHPVSVPGYGNNNGYYSSRLTLVLSRPGKRPEQFDISDCQDIRDY